MDALRAVGRPLRGRPLRSPRGLLRRIAEYPVSFTVCYYTAEQPARRAQRAAAKRATNRPKGVHERRRLNNKRIELT